MMNNIHEDVYTCPSFNSYSTDRLAEIAVKVVDENSNDGVQNDYNNGDEDFEFALVREEFVYDGQIGPVFPVFNRDLSLHNDDVSSAISRENKRFESSITAPSSKLFIEDRDEQEPDYPPSCSSSEADELESVPAGTYCVWRPKAAAPPSPSQCEKSKSTGSASKRWKFRDLLRRSNSEGKDSFVLLTPKNREEKPPTGAPKKAKGKGVSSAAVYGRAPGSPSAHEALYVRNRAIKEGDKKKSYLPYRQGLVGFFVNANGLSKSFPHF
ncbi:hypothetical protein BUALT_Bualt04G0159100 [Buddleja alternifolia]|uniref:Pheromone receptor n=1 Tax=Buddleja alternifolia TaxID=168488 RepID=A0AAV6XTR0_9LAMI|nr:hypothetical protein BUALT_Bualt04G0159100 [Buddleja alternifolia]